MQIYVSYAMHAENFQIVIRKCETRCKYTDCNANEILLYILVSFRAINNQSWIHFIRNKITNRVE